MQNRNSDFPFYRRQIGYAARSQLTCAKPSSSPHTHEMYEFFVLIRGNAYMLVQDKRYPLSPMDLLIISPGIKHQLILLDASEPYERMLFYLSSEYMYTLGYGVVSFASIIEHADGDRTAIYSLPEELFNFMKEIINGIINSHPLTDNYDHLQNMLQLSHLLIALCKHIQSTGNMEKKNEPLEERIVSYIHKNVTRPVTIDELCRQFNISRSYLTRIVRNHCGLTPHQYLLYMRVQYAKSIVATGAALRDACYQSGFGDYSTFLRTFKKYTNNIKPSRYSE